MASCTLGSGLQMKVLWVWENCERWSPPPLVKSLLIHSNYHWSGISKCDVSHTGVLLCNQKATLLAQIIIFLMCYLLIGWVGEFGKEKGTKQAMK